MPAAQGCCLQPQMVAQTSSATQVATTHHPLGLQGGCSRLREIPPEGWAHRLCAQQEVAVALARGAKACHSTKHCKHPVRGCKQAGRHGDCNQRCGQEQRASPPNMVAEDAKHARPHKSTHEHQLQSVQFTRQVRTGSFITQQPGACGITLQLWLLILLHDATAAGDTAPFKVAAVCGSLQMCMRRAINNFVVG